MSMKGDITEYIRNGLLQGAVPPGFDAEFELIETGVLDSLSLMQLVQHLESSYKITLEAADMVPEAFSSVARIVALVDKKTGAA